MNLPIMPKIQIPKHICNNNNHNYAPDMPGFQSGAYKLLALCIFLSEDSISEEQWEISNTDQKEEKRS